MKFVEMLIEVRCPVTSQTVVRRPNLYDGGSDRPRIILSSGMLYSCASNETRAVILCQRDGFSEWASRGFSCNENCRWYETEDGLTKVNLSVVFMISYLRAIDHEAHRVTSGETSLAITSSNSPLNE